jgi:hypothetical protein
MLLEREVRLGADQALICLRLGPDGIAWGQSRMGEGRHMQ